MEAYVVECSRCGRRMEDGTAWNVVFSGGLVSGYVCPDCQTEAESQEAQAHEAAEDLSGARAVSGPEAVEAIVLDIIGRTERAVQQIWDSQQDSDAMPYTEDDLVEEAVRRVQLELPGNYTSAMASGQLVELLRLIARDVITGDLYEDDDG